MNYNDVNDLLQELISSNQQEFVGPYAKQIENLLVISIGAEVIAHILMHGSVMTDETRAMATDTLLKSIDLVEQIVESLEKPLAS